MMSLPDMDWKPMERRILIHLALKGPRAQREIVREMGLPASTINTAKDSLLKRGYIQLMGVRRGRRGAPRKIYGLTPPGLIAAIIVGDLWKRMDEALAHWPEIAPTFLRRYQTLKRWDFDFDVRDISEELLYMNKKIIDNLASRVGKLKPYSRGVDVIYSREPVNGYDEVEYWSPIRDRMNYQFYKLITLWSIKAGLVENLIEMLREDYVLREGWLKWFKWEEERYMRLKEYERRILEDRHSPR